MATVVVSGAVANKPFQGGATWTRLSFVLGLRRLGCRVYFVEQIGRTACVDAAGAVAGFEGCVNRAYFEQVVGRFGLAGSAALVYDGGEQVHGVGYAELL